MGRLSRAFGLQFTGARGSQRGDQGGDPERASRSMIMKVGPFVVAVLTTSLPYNGSRDPLGLASAMSGNRRPGPLCQPGRLSSPRRCPASCRERRSWRGGGRPSLTGRECRLAGWRCRRSVRLGAGLRPPLASQSHRSWSCRRLLQPPRLRCRKRLGIILGAGRSCRSWRTGSPRSSSMSLISSAMGYSSHEWLHHTIRHCYGVAVGRERMSNVVAIRRNGVAESPINRAIAHLEKSRLVRVGSEVRFSRRHQ